MINRKRAKKLLFGLVVYILIIILNSIESKKLNSSAIIQESTEPQLRLVRNADRGKSSDLMSSSSSLPVDSGYPQSLPVSAERNGETLDLDRSNGSAILEDLVNQFLQRNQAPIGIGDDDDDDEGSESLRKVEEIYKSSHQPAENIFKQNQDNQNNSFATFEDLYEQFPAKMSASDQNGIPTTGTSLRLQDQPANNLMFMTSTEDDLDDKHIHYDVLPSSQQLYASKQWADYKYVGSSSEPFAQQMGASNNSTDSVVNATIHIIENSQPSSSNSSTISRTSSIQARSMQSGGQVGTGTGKYARQPPPYASHDNFPTPNRGQSIESQPTDQQSNNSRDASQDSGQLLNSISQITSHLASEATASKNNELPDELVRDRLGATMDHKFIDLNPIEKQPEKSILDSSSLEGRYFYSPKEQTINQHHTNDRYADQELSTGNMLGDLAPGTYNQIASKLVSGFQPDHPEHERSGSGERSSTQTIFQRKSLELMGMQSADRNATASKDHSSSVIHPTHFVASLINLTAPISSPIPQTESLSGDPDVYQVGGFLKQPANIAGSYPAPDQALNALNRPRKQHHQQVVSGSIGTIESQAAPMYSQPANQFSPKAFVFGDNLADFNLNGSERVRHDSSNRYVVPKRNATGGQASGFRSPLSSLFHSSSSSSAEAQWPGAQLPSSYLAALSGMNQPVSSVTASSTTSAAGTLIASTQTQPTNSSVTTTAHTTRPPPSNTFASSTPHQQQQHPATVQSTPSPTTNGFITSSASDFNKTGSVHDSLSSGSTTHSHLPTSQPSRGTTQLSSSTVTQQTSGSGGLGRKVFNLTRVEHISAECSNDLIRTVIVFNGTFRGIIYSSGYVRDPNCIYVTGNGDTRYDFSIKLNKCGTLNRQHEVHPDGARHGGELSRRDQLMWNTLSIQYNPAIEQEWDEHFRVSCEYGSDFWKTISFNPFNVETNTGSPVVFTVDPPQCQMEILRGHGMVGPRQEAVSGPVTVGDPLTLLIHMKSEKAGYDILVKNCVAHNGGHQKMQLIDSNGCVVDERFISPFRGTYNDNDLKHITLYSYLKAFRFTGSPVLYLECEIHMCQTACPPQMCYWRRLSKRSSTPTNRSLELGINNDDDSDEQFLQLDGFQQDQPRTTTTATTAPPSQSRRTGRNFKGRSSTRKPQASENQQTLSDSVSLFQALEVRQERESADAAAYSLDLPGRSHGLNQLPLPDGDNPLVCYQRAQLLGFLFTAVAIFLVALSLSIGCCWRAVSLRRRDRKKLILARTAPIGAGLNSANNKFSHYTNTSTQPSSYASLSASTGTRIGTPMSGVSQNHYQQPQNHLPQQLVSPIIYTTPLAPYTRHKVSPNRFLLPD